VAWTQADLDALNASIAQGVRSTTMGDRTVTFHSLQDMLALRAQMETELAAATETPRPKQRLLYHSGRGF